MELLIIGGTRFVGPALVEAATAGGHQVTLFNRGKSRGYARPDIETIVGDRETDLDRLEGRSWDAVIDTCGYLPRLVRLSAQALKGRVGHYSFVSSLSVYPIMGAAKRDEDAEVLTMEDETVEDITNETYGPLKTGCERAVREAFPDSALILRAGLIVGPRDESNRFTYWVMRTGQGGDAIAPPARQPIQFVDVRDLADFTLRQIELGTAATYHVTGPARRLTFGDLLAAAKDALGSDVRYHHVSDEFLRGHEVGEFMELPLWVSRDAAESFLTFNIDRARRAGLVFRPLAATIRDTWEWARGLPNDIDKPANLPAEKEAKLLAALRD